MSNDTNDPGPKPGRNRTDPRGIRELLEGVVRGIDHLDEEVAPIPDHVLAAISSVVDLEEEVRQLRRALGNVAAWCEDAPDLLERVMVGCVAAQTFEAREPDAFDGPRTARYFDRGVEWDSETLEAATLAALRLGGSARRARDEALRVLGEERP